MDNNLSKVPKIKLKNMSEGKRNEINYFENKNQNSKIELMKQELFKINIFERKK